MRKRHLMAALVTTGGMIGIGSVAHAGEWRLDPWRCPDLREDIIDSRYDNGPRDRREDRIDRRYTDCPASAWIYIGSRYDRYGHVYRNYRAGPPRYRHIDYRNGYLVGTIGDAYFRVLLTDRDRFRYYYRYTYQNGHYVDRYRSPQRYAYHDDRRDSRSHHRNDRRDDRYDHSRDRKDNRSDHRNDRHDDRGDRRNDRHDDRSDRRDDKRNDHGDRRNDRHDKHRGHSAKSAPATKKHQH